MTAQTFSVDFHGHPLTTFKDEEVIFVAMRPIVEGMGLDWGSQQKKLNNQREKFSCTFLPMIGRDSKRRKMLCIPLSKVDEFLSTINSNKCEPSQESNYIKELTEQLISDGWHVELEKQVKFGKIDILATGKSRMLVIEAKLSANTYTRALGQLLAYKESFPTAKLIFACKGNLNSEKKDFLSRYSVMTISSAKELPNA